MSEKTGATTREIRDRAAEMVESGAVPTLTEAINRAAADHEEYHRVGDALRAELGAESLTQWQAGRSKAEILAALRGPEAGS